MNYVKEEANMDDMFLILDLFLYYCLSYYTFFYHRIVHENYPLLTFTFFFKCCRKMRKTMMMMMISRVVVTPNQNQNQNENGETYVVFRLTYNTLEC